MTNIIQDNEPLREQWLLDDWLGMFSISEASTAMYDYAVTVASLKGTLETAKVKWAVVIPSKECATKQALQDNLKALLKDSGNIGTFHIDYADASAGYQGEFLPVILDIRPYAPGTINIEQPSGSKAIVIPMPSKHEVIQKTLQNEFKPTKTDLAPSEPTIFSHLKKWTKSPSALRA